MDDRSVEIFVWSQNLWYGVLVVINSMLQESIQGGELRGRMQQQQKMLKKKKKPVLLGGGSWKGTSLSWPKVAMWMPCFAKVTSGKWQNYPLKCISKLRQIL